jgi:hypothetical protein
MAFLEYNAIKLFTENGLIILVVYFLRSFISVVYMYRRV